MLTRLMMTLLLSFVLGCFQFGIYQLWRQSWLAKGVVLLKRAWRESVHCGLAQADLPQKCERRCTKNHRHRWRMQVVHRVPHLRRLTAVVGAHEHWRWRHGGRRRRRAWIKRRRGWYGVERPDRWRRRSESLWWGWRSVFSRRTRSWHYDGRRWRNRYRWGKTSL